MNKKNIIIDVERMKYPNTGLHNYCKNLMEFLSKTTDFDFTFFTHKRVNLSEDKRRMNRTLLDKIFLKPSRRSYVLWHGTYQTTRYVPYGKIKFVLTIHDLNFLYEKSSEKKIEKLLQKVQKRIDRADYITFISNFTLKEVQKHLNLSGKKTKVIYNGVNLVKFPNFNTPKYQPKKEFLFTVGTVLPKKNIHVLIKLLTQCSYELLIGGIHSDKNYIELIKNEAKKHKVTDKVILLGAISEEEKYWYLNNCTAFMFPSIAEGFGLPVIEAMQLGKPVFLSTYTSLPEIGGNLAYYFTNFEENEMVKVLKNGLEDYQQNNKKPQIIEWASQFTWERAANAYNEVYKEVLL